MDYQQIKDIAKAQGMKVTDLLALAPQNDPYYTGAPATIEQAYWFKGLWDRFGFANGVHLRRVHYQLVSQYDASKPDGSTYQNTEGDWGFLCNAGKYARYLGLVPADAFVDRRNPDPHVYVEGEADYDHHPNAWLGAPTWETPTIPTDLGDIDWSMPRPYVEGYGYDVRDQGYTLEVWIEKSTMDDVLLPLAERLGVNVATSLGFQSITSVIALIKRIRARGKPARIFYVSDFDPAGDGMPVAVARQIQFWIEQYTSPDPDAEEPEIALVPIALTKAQVQQYRLPRIPVKDSDVRKANFAARYGEDGAVELDALEALHPGTLARIVEDAVAPYIDTRLNRRLYQARQEAQTIAYEAWRQETQGEDDTLADLTEQAKTIIAEYDDRLQELAAELATDLAPITERLAELRQAVSEKINEFRPDLPARPQAEPRGDVRRESEWLFASWRDYMEQNEVYKARKAGTNGNGTH